MICVILDSATDGLHVLKNKQTNEVHVKNTRGQKSIYKLIVTLVHVATFYYNTSMFDATIRSRAEAPRQSEPLPFISLASLSYS